MANWRIKEVTYHPGTKDEYKKYYVEIAQNEYLNGLIEGYKQNVDKLKEQKNKEKNDFENRLEK